MFRNRKNSQKPSDGLYKEFRESFPHLRQDLASTSANEVALVETNDDSAAGLRPFDEHRDSHHEPSKGAEPSPRPATDPWNFASTGLTPSFLDPNSNSFNAFASQMPGYYTPGQGGVGALFHSQQAGDLHTPGFHYGLGTPLSMPTSDAAMQVSQTSLAQAAMGIPNFAQAQNIMAAMSAHPNAFASMNPFQLHHNAFASQSFPARANTFAHLESHSSNSPSMADMQLDVSMHESPQLSFHPDSFRANAPATKFPHPLMEKFRYHATLNAATAMVKHEDEIPITYLNKGQAYTLNITDTTPQHIQGTVPRYRTFVRVSFEDPDQRKRPAACWQLWKEGRGTSEAHHRGGRLQAVEFVDPSRASGNDPRRTKMEVESSSFDGFCITWTPSMLGPVECPIPVRFNFLSTDFSHSKGVKGIPVRLCAKTEMIQNPMSPASTAASLAEVSYCKVKLFRDHGAERKLSNDIAHVKKSIEKVNQQIAQIESGLGESGKRKRNSIAQDSGRPSKVLKHRRTWSLASNDSPEKHSAEDELQLKLQILQEMFSSTRPISILFLKGEPEDDADLFPVRLTGQPSDLAKVEPSDNASWDKDSSSSGVSPSPSHLTIATNKRQDSGMAMADSPVIQAAVKQSPKLVKANSVALQKQASPLQAAKKTDRSVSPADQAVKVQTRSPTSGTVSGWVNSIGVDASYQPPVGPAQKAVACFHIQPRIAGVKSDDDFHRAIYLMKRTLKDFVHATCAKAGLEATQVSRTIHVNKQGLHVLFDDADIEHMAEGQAMVAEFGSLESSEFEQQWGLDMQLDGEPMHDTPGAQYELRLYY